MKIIKEGCPERLKLIKETKTFKCSYCLCEFEANKGEYYKDGGKNFGEFFVCVCPACNQRVGYG